jgi:hypothetical protein
MSVVVWLDIVKDALVSVSLPVSEFGMVEVSESSMVELSRLVDVSSPPMDVGRLSSLPRVVGNVSDVKELDTVASAVRVKGKSSLIVVISFGGLPESVEDMGRKALVESDGS